MSAVLTIGLVSLGLVTAAAAASAGCTFYASPGRSLSDSNSDESIVQASLPRAFEAGETFVVDTHWNFPSSASTMTVTVRNQDSTVIGTGTKDVRGINGTNLGVDLTGSATTASITVSIPNATGLSADLICVPPPPPKPTITGLSPSAGPIAGGNSVVITGTAFTGVTGATAVKFGSVNATSYVVNSETQITAVAPNHSVAGDVSIFVKGSGGTNTTSPTYSYVPPPTVSDIDVATGPSAGGTDVIITGVGFLGATAVKFGSVNGTSMSVDSDTQISVTSPPGTGTVAVNVVGLGGASTGGPSFVYIPAPHVTAISPNGGPETGGGTATISGTDFTGATDVSIGAVSVGFSITDDNTIVVTAIPAGTGDVDVTVTGPGGTSPSGVEYSYVSTAAAVTDVSPTRGPLRGGTMVVVTGTDFAGVTSVLFDGVPGDNVQVLSRTQLTVDTPAHAEGAASIAVTNGSGLPSTGDVQFTYVEVPAAHDVSFDVIRDTTDNPVPLDITGPEATSVSVVTLPTHGTATASGTGIVYTPATGYVDGSDSFTYIASNADGDSLPATVTVNVTPPNGTLTLIETTSGGDGTFGFGVDPSASRASITTVNGTGSSAPLSLLAGSYTITADASSSFGLTGIACTGGSSGGIDLERRSVTVDIVAGEAMTCTFTSVNSLDSTTALIDDFFSVRGSLILANLPDRQRRIDRLSGVVEAAGPSVPALMGYLPSLASGSAAAPVLSASLAQIDALTGRQPSRFDMWVQSTVGVFDQDRLSGRFGIVSGGIDYLVDDDLLVGAFVQADLIPDAKAVDGGSIGGTGWLVGPYATMRLTDGLFLDVLAGAGRSDNHVSPDGSYTDDFEATRWMTSVALTGQWKAGNWTVEPGARLSYFEETSESYVDDIGVTIPSVTTGVGQAALGPRVSYRTALDNGYVLDSALKLEGLFDIKTSDDVLGIEDPRGRIEGSVGMVTPGGASLDLSLAYDGIGSSDVSTTSGSASLSLPFN